MTDVAFYCASDSSHLPGVVALLNSLRLHGHSEEFIVLDAGLRDDERALLQPHASIAPAFPGMAPSFRKYGLPERDARVHVIFDADVIATRRLDAPIERAAGGSIVAFADDLSERFHPAWPSLLGLSSLERRTYVNAGILFFPAAALALAARTVAYAGEVDYSQTLAGGAQSDSPFLYGDQDVLNALLAAPPTAAIAVLEHRLAPHPPFPGVQLIDDDGLRCRYDDGVEPYALHHVLAKPWLRQTRPNAYSRLLRRLLLADDVEVRLPPDRLPLRLRHGPVAAVARLNAEATTFVRAQRPRIAIRSRLRDRRRPRAEVADEIS
jgi:hypothetical protein